MGLCRLALDILAHIVGTHRGQNPGERLWVVAPQRYANYAGLTALLRDRHIFLQLLNHAQPGISHHIEIRAGFGLEFGHQNAAHVLATAKTGRRASLALHQSFAVRVAQREAAFGRHQQQRLAFECCGHFEQAQVNGFVA